MDHADHLRAALELAAQRQGFAAPNPAVGAVVIAGNTILGRGTHHGAGHPHAEVEALRDLGERARGATVFVTLEPCCLWGRTPPCTKLLIEYGIREVVYGYRDPNPKVAGGGHLELERAGIACRHLPLPDIDRFYEPYAHWTRTGRPFVTAKLALSLDGKIAGRNDVRVAITGEEINRFTHRCRKTADAILTTSRTVEIDDPLLNARDERTHHAKPLYVIDRGASLPLSANVLRTGAPLTLFHDPSADPERLSALQARGIRLVALAFDASVSTLERCLEQIGEDGHHHLWVEAGGRLFQSLLEARLANQVFLYVGTRWLGEEARSAFAGGARQLLEGARAYSWRGFGADVLCEVSF
jgi:diaminohydroxyphosphoribosylaminopyrimidine deaminase/5-amino-6-(5-phosphoribosylamino)uracil reductase